MKKPNRWERYLRLRTQKFVQPKAIANMSLHECSMSYFEVAKLLRRQHRAYVRMVKKEFSKWEAITLDRANTAGKITMAHYKATQSRDIRAKMEDYAR